MEAVYRNSMSTFFPHTAQSSLVVPVVLVVLVVLVGCGLLMILDFFSPPVVLGDFLPNPASRGLPSLSVNGHDVKITNEIVHHFPVSKFGKRFSATVEMVMSCHWYLALVNYVAFYKYLATYEMHFGLCTYRRLWTLWNDPSFLLRKIYAAKKSPQGCSGCYDFVSNIALSTKNRRVVRQLTSSSSTLIKTRREKTTSTLPNNAKDVIVECHPS